MYNKARYFLGSLGPPKQAPVGPKDASLRGAGLWHGPSSVLNTIIPAPPRPLCPFPSSDWRFSNRAAEQRPSQNEGGQMWRRMPWDEVGEAMGALRR